MEEESPLSINNFKNVYTEPSEIQPPFLEEYDIILDYQVYRSTYNDKIYVIYDHNNKLYYVLEDEGSKNINSDLEKNIIGRINPLE